MLSEKQENVQELTMGKKLSTKKVYIFILEGYSDKVALERLLSRIYRNRLIVPIVMYGDVTSDPNLPDDDKMIKKLEDSVRRKLKEEKMLKSDVAHIFQICDMDGAFVPDDSIVEKDVHEFVYTTTEIIVPNKAKAIIRNKIKRNRIDKLLNMNSLLGIPFKLFFMSCNIDHVLFDNQNLNDDLKVEKADLFFEQYRDCADLLISFLKQNSFGVPDLYSDSWVFIKNDLHSLERHNNMFIIFNDHPSYAC